MGGSITSLARGRRGENSTALRLRGSQLKLPSLFRVLGATGTNITREIVRGDGGINPEETGLNFRGDWANLYGRRRNKPQETGLQGRRGYKL